jgi:hypothetical protein
MPEVPIYTENVILPAVLAGYLSKVDRLEYPPEYFIQHISFGFLLYLQPHLRNTKVLDWKQQESDHYDTVR